MGDWRRWSLAGSVWLTLVAALAAMAGGAPTARPAGRADAATEFAVAPPLPTPSPAAPTTTVPATTVTAPAITAAPPPPPATVGTSVEAPVEPPGEVGIEVATPPPTIDPAAPQIVARPVPVATIPPLTLTSPWEWVTSTAAGYVSTELGCASGTDAGALDAFFAERLGPLLGEDYQHVYPLGGDRFLWIFQDTFVDYSSLAVRLDEASFVHNVALVQQGACFRTLQRGSIARPGSFEQGEGEHPLSRWYWPMGGELTEFGLQVFWVEMAKDGYEPDPGDGLGWHPERTWLATYDPLTFARRAFVPAVNPGVTPIYGYAVASDDEYTYLFGNSFEQNLAREGGYLAGPHSATSVYLARVPRGRLDAAPEYRSGRSWSADPSAAVAISQRYWVENPMQPRYLDGVWVSAAKVDGYWGEALSIDVAGNPWGPWTNVSTTELVPRDGDPLMNTYHAHLMPWRDGNGNLVVVVSQNARNMVRDAFPHPARYRPRSITVNWATPPPERPAPTTTTPTTTARR